MRKVDLSFFYKCFHSEWLFFADFSVIVFDAYSTPADKEKAASLKARDAAKHIMEVSSVSEINIEKWSALNEVREYLGVGRETML